MRKNRIPKTKLQQLTDLEDHLYLLRQNLRGLKENPAHLKALASELRVLACRTSRSSDEGLLWRLASEYQTDTTVHVHHAGSVDPSHPLARSLHFAVVYISRPNSQQEKQLPAEIFNLQDIIYNSESVYIDGESFTHEKLIKAIAEQMGSAHEDEGIERGLVSLKKIILNGVESYFNVLTIDSEMILEVGERIIESAEIQIGYVRRQYPPSITLSVLIKIHEPSLESILIAGGNFYTAETRIDVYLRPQSVVFVTSRRGKQWSLSTTLPENFGAGKTIAFSLEYDLRTQQLKTLSALGNGDLVNNCYLGALSEFYPDRQIPGAHPQATLVTLPLLHERHLSVEEVSKLPDILIETPSFQE